GAAKLCSNACLPVMPPSTSHSLRSTARICCATWSTCQSSTGTTVTSATGDAHLSDQAENAQRQRVVLPHEHATLGVPVGRDVGLDQVVLQAVGAVVAVGHPSRLGLGEL